MRHPQHRTSCPIDRLLAALLMALVASPSVADDGATRAQMNEVFSSYQQLLLLSADEIALRAPANRELLVDAAGRLRVAAASVGEHAKRDDTALLASYLDRFGGWIDSALREEQFPAAQALIYQASEICIACHTRLPDSSDSPRAEAFVTSEVIAELPDYQRGRLELATRRFSAALTSFEKAMRSDVLDPGNPYAHYEVLVPYLSVALAATDNAARARHFLRRRARSGGLREAVRKDLETWASAIEGADAVVAGMDDLDAARALVALAQPLPGSVSDRWPGLAHYLLAAPRLQAYLERTAHIERSAELAEAYYLLGVVTYETATVEWLPHAELYLENAIMIAPNTQLSARAYDLLEAKVVESLDVEMTPDVDAHLEHMRKMAKPVERPEPQR